MTEHLINDDLESSFPLKRAGKLEEVSGLVVFLASDDSSTPQVPNLSSMEGSGSMIYL